MCLSAYSFVPRSLSVSRSLDRRAAGQQPERHVPAVAVEGRQQRAARSAGTISGSQCAARVLARLLATTHARHSSHASHRAHIEINLLIPSLARSQPSSIEFFASISRRQRSQNSILGGCHSCLSLMIRQARGEQCQQAERPNEEITRWSVSERSSGRAKITHGFRGCLEEAGR